LWPGPIGDPRAAGATEKPTGAGSVELPAGDRSGRSGVAAGRSVPWSALVAGLAVVLAVGYGVVRLQAPEGQSAGGAAADVAEPGVVPMSAEAGRRDVLNVALLQRSAETIFEYDPQRNLDIYYDYRQLATEAVSRHPDLDLIVWPESVYTANLRELLVDGPLEFPPGMELTPDEFRSRVEQWRLAFEAKNQDLAQVLQDAAQSSRPSRPSRAAVWSLVGTDVERIHGGKSSHYNTAMLLDAGGKVAGRYYKMHPVMFGEYVPLGDVLPWLYQLTPLPQGLSRGRSPECFEVAGFRLAPNICFESTVPHLIRRHVSELGRRGQKPDFLVTITNDGWFHGSSILDLHLACSVFRAVENRRPILIAANTGITAWIDGNGRIRGQIDPLEEDFLVARVVRDVRESWYTRIGDLPALVCLLVTIVAGVWGAVASRKVANSGE
jgi:apolipoprotein N-acyltransferase